MRGSFGQGKMKRTQNVTYNKSLKKIFLNILTNTDICIYIKIFLDEYYLHSYLSRDKSICYTMT